MAAHPSGASAAIPAPYTMFSGKLQFEKPQTIGFSIEPDGSLNMRISFWASPRQCTKGQIGATMAGMMEPDRLLTIRPDGSFSGSGKSTWPDPKLRIIAAWKVRGRFTSPTRLNGTLAIKWATWGYNHGTHVVTRCHPSTVRFSASKF